MSAEQSRAGVIAERFELGETAGVGGMATVYRAHDRASERTVAVKILHARDEITLARFKREAGMLEQLRHPAIVKCVAYGYTAEGDPYLAMEWLDGEDLAIRLARSGLSVGEAVACAARVASALGYAHDLGLVHRDVKPSNIFLTDRRVDRATLLDFGVARAHGGDVELTKSGVLVGTPAFMSPEQAQGGRVDARGDVFSLGCVLYQCLTGVRAFPGSELGSLLVRVLLEHPPSPRTVRPEVPAALDALVMRMLAKAPEDRPQHGAAVAEELAALGEVPHSVRGQPSEPPVAVTTREQRLLSAVLVDRGAPDRLRIAATAHGGQLRLLEDGSSAIAFTTAGAASDLAGRAARCGLALRVESPDRSVVVATGRGTLEETGPLGGEVVDAALQLLRDATEHPLPAGAVRIDEVTAGLLDGRFVLGGSDRGLDVTGTRDLAEGGRTLLGQETPCVSREAEIGALLALYASAVEEPRARVVLVTSPPGAGKSRLRHELVRRLEPRDDAPTVWLGRGDPMSAGTPYGMLADALRRAAGIQSGEASIVVHRKLRARIGRHVAEPGVARVARFMGELLGVPATDEDPHVQAARADAMLMGDQIRRALTQWIGAECAAGPQLFILEDLHWGDVPTIAALDALLRNLADRPLLVLALARPEVRETFPKLWDARDPQEIRLGPLGSKACERLVRSVLGDAVPAALVAKLVERSQGNAFFLEELIRSVNDDRTTSTLPETVLAMVHARIDAMGAERRQVLRAASVFGEAFWVGGVSALVGRSGGAAGVDASLESLVHDEVLVRRAVPRFPGEQELAFRHGLVREAAYASLPAGDRRLGHGQAAKWLAAAGEGDAMILAEHYERGQKPGDAAPWFERAAEQSLGANDFAGVLARVDRALASGARPEAMGPLRALEAEARNWRGEFAEGERAARLSLDAAEPSSDPFFTALGELALALGVQGKGDPLVELVPKLGALERLPATSPRGVTAAVRLAHHLILLGRHAAAAQLIDGLVARRAEIDALGPGVAARLLFLLGVREQYAGHGGDNLALLEEAVRRFEAAGDLRNACSTRGHAGYARMEVGDNAGADELLRAALATADSLGLADVSAKARHNLGLALSRLGRFDEAEALERSAIAAFHNAGNRRMEGASYEYLALIRLASSDADGAIAAARMALSIADGPPVMPLNRAESLSILAWGLLRKGASAEAHGLAKEGMRMLEELGGIDDGESIIRLVLAESLRATGANDAAHDAIRAARDRLLARAARIAVPEIRATFLAGIPENARTLALVAEWLSA